MTKRQRIIQSMRLRVVSLAMIVFVQPCGAGMSAQVRAPSISQQEADIAARRNAEADERLRQQFGALVGYVSPSTYAMFVKWERTVLAWEKESGHGPSAALAAGVLYDCASRLRNVWPPRLRDSDTTLVWDVVENRRKLAVAYFDKAMVDQNFVEARVRRAMLMPAGDRAARDTLQALSSDSPGGVFAYLASMRLAEIAREQDAPAQLMAWYQHALDLFPASTAAGIGLNAAGSARNPFDSAGGTDPYYDYPCTILTPVVADELARRLRQ